MRLTVDHEVVASARDLKWYEPSKGCILEIRDFLNPGSFKPAFEGIDDGSPNMLHISHDSAKDCSGVVADSTALRSASPNKLELTLRLKTNPEPELAFFKLSFVR